jgi:hypothetical protein
MLASPGLGLHYSLFAYYIAEVCKFEFCKDAAFILISEDVQENTKLDLHAKLVTQTDLREEIIQEKLCVSVS